MMDDEKALLASLHEQQASMVTLLENLCRINSHTDNHSGLADMHQALSHAYAPLADETQSVQSILAPPTYPIHMSGEVVEQTYAPFLFIRKRPEIKKRVLLMGHMDTVFPQNHPFQQLQYINENQLQGPGVADMKGGLVVMLYALLAFENSPEANTLGWDVFINSEEEIGSPSSGVFMRTIAPQYKNALVYEPALDEEGNCAKNRKGIIKATIVAEGRAAHAGRAFEEGRNAICYLAEAIVAIHTLNGKHPGLTINVGKILGGTAINVVAEKAVVKLDIRISKVEDEGLIKAELETIMHQLKRPDYALHLHCNYDRPVKIVSTGTQHLFEHIQTVAHRLGQRMDWKDSGGCCDGNNLAALGVSVIDTMGVRGGGIHSSDEYIILNSLTERAALSAALLIDMARELA